MNALLGQLLVAALLAVGVYVVISRISFKANEQEKKNDE